MKPLIQHAQTKYLPHFPILEAGKTKRAFTKHYINLHLWLEEDQLRLLSWLCYQTSADNTFKYSTHLLKQYQEAVFEAKIQYSVSERRPHLNSIRVHISSLIYRGLILQTGKSKILMINPMLTYRPDIINSKNYKEAMVLYQLASPGIIKDMCEHFSKLVSTFLESKKKNYVYGQRK